MEKLRQQMDHQRKQIIKQSQVAKKQFFLTVQQARELERRRLKQLFSEGALSAAVTNNPRSYNPRSNVMLPEPSPSPSPAPHHTTTTTKRTDSALRFSQKLTPW